MFLIKQDTLCSKLDMSRNGLRSLAAKDSSMPKPIKLGKTKQAPVFYDANEIAAWIELKKSTRGVMV